jgi:hypothetical protein
MTVIEAADRILRQSAAWRNRRRHALEAASVSPSGSIE